MATKPVPREESSSSYWTSREAYLLALVCLFAGIALGYLFRGSSAPAPISAGAAAPAPVAPAPGSNPVLHSAQALEPVAAPLVAAVKANPKNVPALIQLGNLYYDSHVYPEAIEYYRRALELEPNNPNVRTDLGTAYWYSGFADQAIAEYEKVLAAQPDFAPAMMNMGIVKLEGSKDPRGAIAAWEKLLATNPQHPEKDRIVALIAQAKSQVR